MKATTPGMNRTGAAVSPEGTEAMTQAAAELTPPVPIDTSDSDADRILYIQEASALGSIPPPAGLKGMVKSGVAKLRGGSPSMLLDKIGERIAFERGGVRLYEALIRKHEAASGETGAGLRPAAEVVAETEGMAALAPLQGETAAQTLLRIRSEEHAHFRLLCEAMSQLGGDPTAQTPCADVITTASLGLIQVVTDSRTTLAQCLNAVLSAELIDNAGWELLIQLADDAGEAELSGRFLGALAQEQEHLATIKAWLTDLVATRAGTPAV
jgi:rubrerythrin